VEESKAHIAFALQLLSEVTSLQFLRHVLVLKSHMQRVKLRQRYTFWARYGQFMMHPLLTQLHMVSPWQTDWLGMVVHVDLQSDTEASYMHNWSLLQAVLSVARGYFVAQCSMQELLEAFQ
jgi:hypothetical protein